MSKDVFVLFKCVTPLVGWILCWVVRRTICVTPKWAVCLILYLLLRVEVIFSGGILWGKERELGPIERDQEDVSFRGSCRVNSIFLGFPILIDYHCTFVECTLFSWLRLSCVILDWICFLAVATFDSNSQSAWLLDTVWMGQHLSLNGTHLVSCVLIAWWAANYSIQLHILHVSGQVAAIFFEPNLGWFGLDFQEARLLTFSHCLGHCLSLEGAVL